MESTSAAGSRTLSNCSSSSIQIAAGNPTTKRIPDADGTVCRWDRRFEEQLNYRLKDVVRHLLGLDAPGFPGAMAALGLRAARHVPHVRLLITRELYLHLRPQLSKEESKYYDELIAPITHIVADMTFTG